MENIIINEQDKAIDTIEEVQRIIQKAIDARNKRIAELSIKPGFISEEEINELVFGAGIDSFNRLHFYHDLIHEWNFKLEPTLYWKCLGDCYNSSDNLYRHRQRVKRLFLAKIPERNSLMNAEELQFISELPNEITIYRAMTINEFQSKNYGISWTLSPEVANFFKDKYIRNYSTNNQKKMIAQTTIDKSQIIAYFGRREESEIITFIPKVKEVSRCI